MGFRFNYVFTPFSTVLCFFFRNIKQQTNTSHDLNVTLKRGVQKTTRHFSYRYFSLLPFFGNGKQSFGFFTCLVWQVLRRFSFLRFAFLSLFFGYRCYCQFLSLKQYELFMQVSYSRMTRRFYWSEYGWQLRSAGKDTQKQSLKIFHDFHRSFTTPLYEHLR